MELTCPACAAAYNVPDAMIGEGRQIRCARCGHQWFATPSQGTSESSEAPPAPPAPPPAEPEPAPTTVLAPEPEPEPEPEAPAEPELTSPPPRSIGLWLAWAASLALVVGAAGALWQFQAAVTAVWPPFGRLAAWFGG